MPSSQIEASSNWIYLSGQEKNDSLEFPIAFFDLENIRVTEWADKNIIRSYRVQVAYRLSDFTIYQDKEFLMSNDIFPSQRSLGAYVVYTNGEKTDYQLHEDTNFYQSVGWDDKRIHYLVREKLEKANFSFEKIDAESTQSEKLPKGTTL